MLKRLKSLFGKTYEPLNKIEISELLLEHNYSYLSSINPSISVAPVLKSNAYGHGIVQIAKTLDSANAPFFCVDSIYEGYELLKAGIKTKILIMGFIDPENLRVKKLPFSYAVYSKEQLEAVNHYQKGAGVHIKFDSGMHRLGINLEALPEFILTLNQFKSINIEGFMSHFAESENPSSPLTILQVKNIKSALSLLSKSGISPRYIHCANSGGLLHEKELKLNTFSNVARTGLDLYGIDPREDKNDPNLKPVLRLTTKIVQIKQLNVGDKVGYNGTFTAKTNMTMAVIPIGYYDGIDRRLSNKGTTTVDGISCPIIGRVSMNITAIDISAVQNAHIGQQVIVFSDNSKENNSIKNSAKLCDTIPYELLIHLAASTRREVV